MTGGAWHPLGAEDDFAAGKLRTLRIAGRCLAVGRSESGVFAVDDSCPHAGASLGEGLLDGDFVVCPLHAFAYDVRTGDCEDDLTGVEVFEVRSQDGRLEVKLPDKRRPA